MISMGKIMSKIYFYKWNARLIFLQDLRHLLRLIQIPLSPAALAP